MNGVYIFFFFLHHFYIIHIIVEALIRDIIRKKSMNCYTENPPVFIVSTGGFLNQYLWALSFDEYTCLKGLSHEMEGVCCYTYLESYFKLQ